MLPLVYKYDLKGHMKIHFLKPSEKDNQINLLRKYLSIVDIQVPASQIDPSNAYINDSKVSIMCCYLDKFVEKPNSNGISLYVDYLNEFMNPSSKSSIKPNIQSSFVVNKCKNSYCNKNAMDQDRYFGLCYDCFRKQV